MYKEIYEKKFGLGDILFTAWSVYKQQFLAILFITLAIYIPINIILFILTPDVSSLNDFRLYTSILKVLDGLVGIIAFIGVTIVVERTINGDDQIDWIESLKMAFSKWGTCLITSILGGLIILGFTFLLIVPGIIWAIYYAFIIPIVVIKGLKGKEALDYSKALVKGQWWNVFGVLFIIGLISGALGAIIGAVLSFLPSILGIIPDTLIDIVASYFTVATTLFFINLDFIKNGSRKIEVAGDDAMLFENNIDE